ncbi:ribonuclease E/G [Parasphingopyxis sp. GrpM-11]|uniref:Ribonuclease E/G n=1 Tax=Parasphingopyxis marina TaxID=2761622 RepID=A0A842I491_9SPHN|nr:ribonuclease E/G [Parasphingopyxis marina]
MGTGWLYEAGIGEERAALVENGIILEALIEAEGEGARTGAIHAARLAEILPGKKAGLIVLDTGEEALIDPLPIGVTEGGNLFARITRSAIPEPGRPKRAKARHVEKADAARPAPSLRERLEATGIAVTELAAHGPDRLEEAGWSELLEQAATGAIPFPGGALRIDPTPAMTVVDVDGALPPADLAVAGARAAGEAIRRLGIGGSTVIDLPSLEAKAARQAAAEAFDAALPQPFERTAVNGFGLLQIVRKRAGPSILERVRYDAAATAARTLLRTAERTAGAGTRTLTAHPAVIAGIEAVPDWLPQLARRQGADIALVANPSLALWRGHVSAAYPG